MDCLAENVHYVVKYKTGFQPKTAYRDSKVAWRTKQEKQEKVKWLQCSMKMQEALFVIQEWGGLLKNSKAPSHKENTDKY